MGEQKEAVTTELVTTERIQNLIYVVITRLKALK